MRKTLLLWLFFAGIFTATAQQKPESEKPREPEKTVTPAKDHAKEIQMRREEKRKKMEAARQNVRDKIKSDTIIRR